MRIEQSQGEKGSLKWIQIAIARHPSAISPPALSKITWLSPRASDDFAEYRDAAFLRLLRLGRLAPALADFWPKRGPQWDALGLCDSVPVLVEAKAHLAEFNSPASAAGATSRAKIMAAFAQVKADLAPDSGADWSRTFYQYANRLAHLWWLHQQGVAAHLVFVGFLNDRDMQGPSAAQDWQDSYHMADAALGLPVQHRLSGYIHHVHPHVGALN